MGHKNWFMVDNNAQTFEAKIAFAKSQVQRILGRGGGTSFYKKFLLKKSKTRSMQLTNVPINLPDGQHFEESEIEETFINYRTSESEGKVKEASIEKKGNNQAFAYTLKVTLEKNKQQITKKRSISAYEYIDYMH